MDASPMHNVYETTDNAKLINHIDGLLQDSSDFSALAIRILQSCTKPASQIMGNSTVFRQLVYANNKESPKV